MTLQTIFVTALVLGLSINTSWAQDINYDIEFSVKATPEEAEEFEDDVVPWASIKNAKRDAARLIDADKKIIAADDIILIIDYPIDEPVKFPLHSKDGFTKSELLIKIGEVYKKVYEAEESTSSVKTIPIGERKGLINRNKTDGKYGICCHDIDDLDVSSASISCENKTCVVELYIES